VLLLRMETRKVQKVSTGTFIISLPKRWVLRNQLRSGSILSIEETASGNLAIGIMAQERKKEDPIISDISLLEESIVAYYSMGAQRVVIMNLTPVARARALSILQYLPGFEVTHDEERRLVISCLIDESNVRIHQLIERMCALLEYGVSSVITDNADALQKNEQEIDRAYHLCQRILTRATHDPAFLEQSGIPSLRTIPSYQLLVKRIEHCGDAIKDLSHLDVKEKAALQSIITFIVRLLRSLTAGKLSRERLVREDLPHNHNPQLLFLRKTAEDIREEMVHLHLGTKMIF